MMALKNKRGPFSVLTYAFSTSDKDCILELATDIGLEGELHRQAGELSHGQKQWLEIGMLLAQQPKLLLVDEPTEGIQPSVIKDIGRAIEYLRDTQGLAIILGNNTLNFVANLQVRCIL